MSRINKLTTSFIKITNALEKKVKNQDEYNIYVSMLDEEELECLKYVQRLRKYNNRQQLPSPTDTNDESKPEKKKRGRKKKGRGKRRRGYVGADHHVRRGDPPSVSHFS